MTLVIISAGIDLSVGSMVVLSAAVGLTAVNWLIGKEWSEATAVAVGVGTTLLVGLAAGSLNGALVVVGRIAPFIATLGGLAAYRSMALAIAEAGRSDLKATPSSESSGARGFRSGGNAPLRKALSPRSVGSSTRLASLSRFRTPSSCSLPSRSWRSGSFRAADSDGTWSRSARTGRQRATQASRSGGFVSASMR
jgi:hypothetical protein